MTREELIAHRQYVQGRIERLEATKHKAQEKLAKQIGSWRITSEANIKFLFSSDVNHISGLEKQIEDWQMDLALVKGWLSEIQERAG